LRADRALEVEVTSSASFETPVKKDTPKEMPLAKAKAKADQSPCSIAAEENLPLPAHDA